MMQPSSTGASGTGPVDRSAAFAAGPTRIPRRFVHLVLLAAAVLGIGGALLDHVLDAAGVSPNAPSVTSPALKSRPVAQSSTVEHEAVVPGGLAAFMGLTRMTPGQARPFSLLDEHGQTMSLDHESARVVVLTFFDGRCDDICPVVADEIEKADADLAGLARQVSFLTINTDPAATEVSGLQGVLVRTGLGRVSNWYMLTGSVAQLNTVWRSYGITVSFDPATGEVEHNDVMYFLDDKGRFRYSATPFADEGRPSGIYELPSAEIARFARGIATYASQLVVER